MSVGGSPSDTPSGSAARARSGGRSTPARGDTADRLSGLLARRLRGDEAAQLAVFTRALVGRGGALAETLDDEAATALTWSSFQFFRGPGELPRLRVVSPTYVEDGWDATVTLIETVMVDRPFVVDTLQAELAARGIPVRAAVHPLFATERDAVGGVTRLALARDGDRRESFVQLAIPRCTAPGALAELREVLAARLADVTVVTDDFPLMVARAQQTAGELDELARATTGQRAVEAAATAEFLRWLVDGAFVFLGYREYGLADVDGVPTLALRAGSGLGLLRREAVAALAAPCPLAALPERVREWLTGASLVTMDKTVALAPVHRRQRMDNFGIKEFDAQGRVVAERRFLGLLTSQAHATESSEVPLLRRLLRQVVTGEGVLVGSHDHKAILEIFNTFPKGELFAAAPADVRADIRAVLAARRSEQVVTIIRERAQRVTVVVSMPSERFSGAVRAALDRLVADHVGGQLLDAEVVVGSDARTRLHYAFTPGLAALGAEGTTALRTAIAATLASWAERLKVALAADGTVDGRGWSGAFPLDYQARVAVETAVGDIKLVAAATVAAPAIAFDPARHDARSNALRLVTVGTPLVLADVLPILEGFGFRVLAEDRVIVHPEGDEPRFLHTFSVQGRHGQALDHEALEPRLVPALRAVVTGHADADALNRLVVEAGLDLNAVQAVRTWAGWAAQAGLGTRSAVRAALVGSPAVAAAWFAYLAARFRPGAVVGAEREAFLASLAAVESLRDDTIWRGMLDALEATVRTTAFTRGVDDVVAFKLQVERISWVPRPVPLFEVYVLGLGVEGVHLRAGRVARGGIRASDRPDDLRTEVLALMKTQTEKNAVIVPTGAKGGFVVRGAAGPRPTAAETLTAYRSFIAALLELSDNVVGDRVVTVPDRPRYDDDDPYVVVAADKGTATFSDAANAIATERGFWLGDAFASGGSAGYDHKALGITARGAWECLRIHARVLGLDADRAPLRVVGIGDPSGDVFGNGMGLSPNLRLVAAFNHQHIFIDPDPDPVRSAAERQRLFASGGGWGAYDRRQLSPGGCIVERAAKAVRLSGTAQALLGVAREVVSGEALVRAVLGLDVDVMFNGGIGTYVKAPQETPAAVGDPTNDAVRVDADDVRARIIVEGGNLGITPAARIALALAGRLLNSDAIDNSAGVDCSDHEVNLKICLAAVVAAGGMDRLERDAVLARATPEVVTAVLAHNRAQGRLLAWEAARSQRQPDRMLTLQHHLEKDAGLDRIAAGLPDSETLGARRVGGAAYTRPEVAILVARAKLHFQRVLLAGDLTDQPLLQSLLLAYFPQEIRTRFPAAITGHRLRREIIATQLVNACVDAMGPGFVYEVATTTGAPLPAVLRAWWIAWQLADGAALSLEIDAAGLGYEAEAGALRLLADAVDAVVRWLLARPQTVPPDVVAPASLRQQLTPLCEHLSMWLTAREATAHERQVAELELSGAAPAVARALAATTWLPTLLSMTEERRPGDQSVEERAARYFGWAAHVDFGWLVEQLRSIDDGDPWTARAIDGLAADISAARLALASALPHQVAGVLLDRIQAHCRTLGGAGQPSLAALTVVTQDLRHLAASMHKGE